MPTIVQGTFVFAHDETSYPRGQDIRLATKPDVYQCKHYKDYTEPNAYHGTLCVETKMF